MGLILVTIGINVETNSNLVMRDYAKASDLKRLRHTLQEVRESLYARRMAINTINGAVGQLKDVREIVKERPKRNLSDRLVKLGFILLVLPIPVVTEIIGVIFIATGMITNRFFKRRIGAANVYRELDDIMEEIRLNMNAF